MKTKKIISMILAVIMVLTCVPFAGLSTIAGATYSAPVWTATSEAVILSAVAEPTEVIRVAASSAMPFYSTGEATDIVVKATSDGVPYFNGSLATLAQAGNSTYIEPEVKITFGVAVNGNISGLTCAGYTNAACTTLSGINLNTVSTSGSTAVWKINLNNSTAQEQTTIYWKIGYVYSGMQYYTYAASSVMPVSNTPGASLESVRTSNGTGGGYEARLDFAFRVIGEGVYGNAKANQTGAVWSGSNWNKYGAFSASSSDTGVFNFAVDAPNSTVGTNATTSFIYNTDTDAGEGLARGSARRNSNGSDSKSNEDVNLNYAYDENRPWVCIFKDVNDSFDDINLRYQLMSTGYGTSHDVYARSAYIILSRYENAGWSVGGKTNSNGDAGETYSLTGSTATNIRIDYGSGYAFSNTTPGGAGTWVTANFHGDAKFSGYSENSTEAYCGEKQFTWHIQVQGNYNSNDPCKIGTSMEFVIYNTDKSALRTLLTSIQSANPQEATYTASSWATFKTAYMAAFAELANGMSQSQATINSVVSTLQSAYNGLVYSTADVTAYFVLSSDTTVNVPGGPSDGRTETASAYLNYTPLAGATVTCTAPAEITNNGVKYTLDNTQTQTATAADGVSLTFKYSPAVVSYSFDPVDRRAGSAVSISLISGTTYNLATELPGIYTNQGKNYPSLTNYVIEGWYTGYDSDTGEYTNKVTDLTAGISGETLYAKWKLAPVTIQYDFAGKAAPSGYDSYSVDPYTILTQPADPVISGYAFNGWYADASYTSEFSWNTPVAVGAGTITIYAKFTSYDNQILFEENGGEEVDDIDVSDKVAGDTITLPETTRSGYTFDGWCRSSDLSDTPVAAGSYTLTSDLIGGGAFYAKWTAKTFTVHFNIKYNASTASPIDTSSNPADVVCSSGQPMNPVPADPIRYGWVFKGWTLSSSKKYQEFTEESAFNAAISYKYNTDSCDPTDDAEITLYPMWVKSTTDAYIKVETFKMMYGEAVSTDSSDVTIASGDIIKVRMTPNTTFYTGSSEFVYMYDSNFFELVGSGDDAFTLNSESGYIAKIGSDYSGYTDSPANSNCPSGYNWIQIAIDPDVQNGKYLPGAMNDGKWVVEFELRVKATSGSGIVYMSNDWTRNATNLSGIQFFGHCSSASDFVWNSSNYLVTPDLTLATSTVTITGTNEQSTITADPNGGKWSDDSTSAKSFTGDVGEEITSYVAPTKTGYTLTSWVNSTDTSDTWVEGYYGSSAQNGKTYNAQWSPNPYVITWDADGGKFGTSSTAASTATQDVVYDEVLVSYATEPVKDGYKFIGWAEAPYTGSTCYVDENNNVTTAPAEGTLVDFTSTSPVVTADKTYYAVWAVAPTTEITYTIHYVNKMNGNEMTNTGKKTSWYNGAVLHIVDNDSTAANTITDVYVKYSELPTIANYHFDEFDERNTSLTATIGADSTIDVYYYADIKTATFNANGGTYDLTDVTASVLDERGEGYEYTDSSTYKLYGAYNSTLRSSSDTYSPAVAPVTPTKAGYDFVGWATSATATSKTTISQRFASNYTYYAVYAAQSVTNTFNANGGNWSGSTDDKTVATNVGATIKTPTAPAKSGYTFKGWATSSTATEGTTSLGTQGSTANTYYAVWQLNNQTYNINVYYMGTDGNYPSTASNTSSASGIGTITADPATYALDGFTYDGTAQGTAASITLDETTVGTTQSIKLYYSRNKYTLSFVNESNTAQNVTYTDTAKVYYGADITSLVPTTFTREGYAQNGWVEGTPSTMPAADTTYTAKWDIRSYQLRFVSEGSDYVAPTTVEYGSTVSAPEENPSKTGYTFQYWTLDLTALEEAVLPTTMPANEVTYYAYFTVDSHNANFDSLDGEWSDGTSGVKSISFKYGDILEAPEESPTKYGYDFKGWTPEVTGTMGTKDISYTAVYTAKTIAVKFNDNHDSSADYTVDSTFNSAITLPDTPVRAGYQFAGWATSASATSGSTSLGTLTTETPDTYYAVWTANTNNLYTIIVYKQGTDGQYNADDSVLTTKTTGNDAVTAEVKTVTGDAIEGFTFDAAASTLTLTIQPDTTGEVNVFSLYYTRNQYKFTVDDDGAETESNVYYGAAVTDPVANGKTGYTFSSWTWSDADGAITKPATMPAKAIKATAVYTVNTYLATFKANGDSWSKTTSAEYGAAIVAPDALPTKTGYTCAGWSDTAESNNAADALASLGNMPVNGKTFYAVWQADTITNKFWNNDGTEAFQTADSLYDSEIVLPTAPVKAGYTFQGWATSAAATTGSTALGTQSATTATEYYAVWKADSHTYTVNIYTQDIGGGDNYTLVNSITDKTADVDSTVYFSAADDITREGFTAPATVSGVIPATGTLVLEFKYTRDVHTVTYRSSGSNAFTLGTFTDAQANRDADASTANVRIDNYYYGETIVPATVTRTGYTSSWTGGTLPETMGTEDLSLTHKWIAKDCTVTFDANTGVFAEGATTAKTVKYDAAITAEGITAPTKTGYTLTGWSRSATEVVAPGTMDSEAGITLYAVWQIDTYTATFVANGTTFTTTSADYNAAVVAPETNPTKTGYTFVGWKADAESNTPSDALASLGNMPVDGTTFYAVWSIDSHKVEITYEGAGDATPEKYSQSYEYNASYSVASPEVAGYTPDKATVAGTMGTEDVAVTVTYSANSYYANFIANGTNWSTTPADFGTAIAAPATNPTKTGYTFKGWKADAESNNPDDALESLGNMPVDGTTFYAVWEINTYTLVINYGAAGSTAASQYTQDYEYGAAYSVNTPAVEGYTPSQAVVSGTIGVDPAPINVTYTANEYTLTIAYKYADGSEAAATKTQQVAYDSAYSVASPEITGYTPDKATVAGTMDNINGLTITVKYTANLYKLTINYSGVTVGSNPATYEEQVAYDSDYSVESPAVTGYTPDIAVVTGTLKDANDITVNVTYVADKHTVTLVKPKLLADGTLSTVDSADADTYETVFTVTEDYGTAVTGYTEPTIANYTFNQWSEEVPATIPAEDKFIVASFDRVPVTLAIAAEEGVTTVIDEVTNPTAEFTGYIYGLKTRLTTDDFQSKYVQVIGDGHLVVTPVEAYAQYDRCGTGTKVELVDNVTDAVVATYYVVIFGDVNGDGNVSSADTSIVKAEVAKTTEWSVGVDPETTIAPAFLAANLDDIAGKVITGEDTTCIKELVMKVATVDQATGIVSYNS